MWKSTSWALSGKCAATTAVFIGGSPRPPSLEFSEEIGFQLSHSGALGLPSREQTLGPGNRCSRSLSWPMSLLIGNRDLKAHLSFLLFELHILVQGSWTSRSGAISFEMSSSLFAVAAGPWDTRVLVRPGALAWPATPEGGR